MRDRIYAAVMAGGAGTRFWPASRSKRPKQFLDVLNTGRTLIQQTYDRYAAILDNQNIKVVCGEKYSRLVQEQLPLDAQSIIPEPFVRNTAAAVALTAFDIASKDPEAVIVMTPADHHIGNDSKYQEVILECAEFAAAEDVLITLGIQPTSAHTGYGYIKRSEKKGAFYKVERFTEKPAEKKAREFLESGDYYWNAGIFVWSAKSILKAFSDHAGEIYRPLTDLYKKGSPDLEDLHQVYKSIPSISVDYAIMEKAENTFTIPADFGWSDLGSWNTIYQLSEKDQNGHVSGGAEIQSLDSRNCFVRGKDDKLYALIGLEDIALIEMDDVTVLFPLSRDQEIKELLAGIRKERGNQYD